MSHAHKFHYKDNINIQASRTEVASDGSFIKLFCTCGLTGYIDYTSIEWEHPNGERI